MTELSHEVFGSSNSQKKEDAGKDIEQDDLQSLIELGCIIDKKTIGDKIFELRSLSAIETMEITKMAGDKPSPEDIFELNVFILAKTIKSINGKSLESYYPGEINENGVIDIKMNIIKSMQLNVIAELLKFYNEITERCNSNFDLDQVKN